MIKIAIVGYGNLGKGVEQAITLNEDMEVFGVFTKRDKKTVLTKDSAVYNYSELINFKEDIDVCILCGSSEKDLRTQTVDLSQHFNCIDSFDIHSLIPEHLENVDKVAKLNNRISIISVGWDPGIFSMQRAVLESILPQGETESFWGYGVSQGHSEVVKRIEGVKMAVQYSIPNKANIEAFKNNKEIDASTNHKRHCYVVADESEHDRIEQTILNTEHYFKGGNTQVIFISEDEMLKDHQGMPHGGHVIRRSTSSEAIHHLLDFEIEIDSNPEFTASILVAYARAAYKMNQRGNIGAFTVLDVLPFDLSQKSRIELIKEVI